jgi:hypothetical protein
LIIVKIIICITQIIIFFYIKNLNSYKNNNIITQIIIFLIWICWIITQIIIFWYEYFEY